LGPAATLVNEILSLCFFFSSISISSFISVSLFFLFRCSSSHSHCYTVSGDKGRTGVSTTLTDAEVACLSVTEIDRVTAETLTGCCFAASQFALTISLPMVQARAVQALCGVFIGCPRLMLLIQENGLLTRLLGTEFPDTVHERLLQSLKGMMLAEEARLESGAALLLMKESGANVGKQVRTIFLSFTFSISLFLFCFFLTIFFTISYTFFCDVLFSSLQVLGPEVNDSDATITGFVLQQHLPALLG
jgi:hypothetical protein